MNIPARVLSAIDKVAAEHETTSARILDGDRATESVVARHQVIAELAKEPKPSGKPPGIRELARWFNMTPGGVSRIVAHG